MFKPKPTAPSEVDEALTDCYAHLKGYEPDTKEHSRILKQIEKLEKIKNQQSMHRFKIPSADAMLTAGVSLLGVLLILNYERTEVLTSKAIGFVHKPKL